jgi:hypothetical protein
MQWELTFDNILFSKLSDVDLESSDSWLWLICAKNLDGCIFVILMFMQVYLLQSSPFWIFQIRLNESAFPIFRLGSKLNLTFYFVRYVIVVEQSPFEVQTKELNWTINMLFFIFILVRLIRGRFIVLKFLNNLRFWLRNHDWYINRLVDMDNLCLGSGLYLFIWNRRI